MSASRTRVRRFSVSLPHRLATALDDIARERGISRSALLAEWAARAERERFEASMAEGYRAMAAENREMAEQSLPAAAEVVLRRD